MEVFQEEDGSIVTEVAHNINRDYMKKPDAIAESVTKAKSSAERFMENIKDYCFENPGKTVGLGLSVGTMMGVALAKILRLGERTS